MRPHKKLDVYKKSIELLKLVYEVSNDLPDDEKFGLISQMKRAAVSVPVNISEGAARKSQKEFRQFLYISSGSLSELESLFEICFELNFVNQEIFDHINKKCQTISAMLLGLIKSLKLSNT